MCVCMMRDVMYACVREVLDSFVDALLYLNPKLEKDAAATTNSTEFFASTLPHASAPAFRIAQLTLVLCCLQ